MYEKLKRIYHFLMAWGGSVWYGHPSRRLFVVGVTGTKGKSSTLEILNAVLEAAGKKTALLGSVRRKVLHESKKGKSGNTMPGRFAIQKFLYDAVCAGAEYALIEVTSEGVLQHRHRFIDWDAAFFLNIAPEHIERHGSFENYRAAKVSFFKHLSRSKKPVKYFFINEDDENASYFADAAKRVKNGELFPFSLESFYKEAASEGNGLLSAEGRRALNEWFAPDFNIMNAAAAWEFAKTQNIPWKTFLRALWEFQGVPGRFEFVQQEPFAVVVDYAHTPDSLEKAYDAVRPEEVFGKHGSLICVLGSAGGGRDKWKRREMGKIAASKCDFLILTNEDPFDEDPEAILKEMEKGFLECSGRRTANYWKIVDRKEAIRKAISLAKEGDVVMMTGKGSETSIRIAHGKKIPWNEREVAEKLLREK